MKSIKNKQKKRNKENKIINYYFWKDNKMLWTIILLFFSLFFVASFLELPFFTSFYSYTLGMIFGFLHPVVYFFVIFIAISKIFNIWPLQFKYLNLNFWTTFTFFSLILWLSTSIYKISSNFQLNVFQFEWNNEIQNWIDQFKELKSSNPDISPLFFPNWKQIGILNLVWYGLFTSLTSSVGSLIIPVVIFIVISCVIFIPEEKKVKTFSRLFSYWYWSKKWANPLDEKTYVNQANQEEQEYQQEYQEEYQEEQSEQFASNDFVQTNKTIEKEEDEEDVPILEIEGIIKNPNNYSIHDDQNQTPSKIGILFCNHEKNHVENVNEEFEEEDDFQKYQKTQTLVNFQFNKNSNSNFEEDHQWWNTKTKESNSEQISSEEQEKMRRFMQYLSKKGYSKEEIAELLFNEGNYRKQEMKWDNQINKNLKDDRINVINDQKVAKNKFFGFKNEAINEVEKDRSDQNNDLPFDNPFD